MFASSSWDHFHRGALNLGEWSVTWAFFTNRLHALVYSQLQDMTYIYINTDINLSPLSWLESGIQYSQVSLRFAWSSLGKVLHLILGSCRTDTSSERKCWAAPHHPLSPPNSAAVDFIWSVKPGIPSWGTWALWFTANKYSRRAPPFLPPLSLQLIYSTLAKLLKITL